MNTNIKTTLSNILAPLTGEKSDTKGTKTAIFDPRKSEFSEIVRKMQATYEKGRSDETSKNQENSEKKSAEDILGLQISARLSELIANKRQKTEDSETSDSHPIDIEAALSDIAALMEASPEQIENLENLQLNGEVTPETMEEIQEIKDFLASVNQSTAEQAAPGSETTVAGPETLQTSETSAAEAVNVPTAPETATELEKPQQTAAVPAIPVENTLPKSVETPTQTAENAFSQLNETVKASETNTQQQGNPDSRAGDSIARQVAQAIIDQQKADAAAVEEKPLQQIPMPNQILNSDTDKAVRPLTGDILKDITHTSDSIVDEPVAAQTAESTGPATDVAALGKADGPAASNADIARQVQETIISSSRAGDKQVVIRLDPPELGQVTLRFIERPEGITGVLHVEQSQTRQEIERALPEIIQNLQNASVQIKKIDIVQTPQQQFDNSRNDSAFSGQQSAFQEPDGTPSQPHQGGYTDRGSAFDENPAESQASDMQWTDKSINMLI